MSEVFSGKCPICGEKHELNMKVKKNKIGIKGIEIEYDEKYFKCPKHDGEESEFCPAKLFDENLFNARNEYRKKFGLLTSDEIIDIRKEYGLSQVELSRMLGLGDVTIARYETKAIQEPLYDDILRRVKQYPMELLELLDKHKDKFTNERYDQIRSKIIENQGRFGEEYEKRKILLNNYAAFQEPSSNNGFKVLDIDLIEKIVSYMAFSRENLYKTILMKFLWYIDKISFERYGKTITGLVYIHENYGALPIGHYNLIGLKNINSEEIVENGVYKIRIMPSERVNFYDLDKDVKSIIDEVLMKFKKMDTNEIVATMHSEDEYIKTNMYEIIRFEK